MLLQKIRLILNPPHAWGFPAFHQNKVILTWNCTNAWQLTKYTRLADWLHSFWNDALWGEQNLEFVKDAFTIGGADTGIGGMRIGS